MFTTILDSCSCTHTYSGLQKCTINGYSLITESVDAVEGEKNSYLRSAKLTQTTYLYHSNVKTLRGSSKKAEIYMSQVVKNQFPTWTGIPGVLYTDCQHYLYPQPSKPKNCKPTFILHARNICISQYPLFFSPSFMKSARAPIPHNWEQ